MRFKIIILCMLLLSGCKKSEDRRCWKLTGEDASLTVPIDSVQKFILNNGLRYVLHQSSDRKIVVVGGKNMLKQVDVESSNYQLTISNRSYCHFLRDFDRKVNVHIYYPFYSEIYAEISDSLIFADTVTGNFLQIEMREAGGVAKLTTQLNDLRIIVSAGPGSFIVDGFAKYATLKTQGQGFGNALKLKSKYLFGYQNSGAPLKLNLDDTEAEILIDGAGNIEYVGQPSSLDLTINGAGKFMKL